MYLCERHPIKCTAISPKFANFSCPFVRASRTLTQRSPQRRRKNRRETIRAGFTIFYATLVSRIIFDFLDEQPRNDNSVAQRYTGLLLAPPPLPPPPPLPSPSFCPLCHVNRGEKFMSRATPFPRRLLSGSHFVYVRIVAGTMARAATIMRPPQYTLATPLHISCRILVARPVPRH